MTLDQYLTSFGFAMADFLNDPTSDQEESARFVPSLEKIAREHLSSGGLVQEPADITKVVRDLRRYKLDRHNILYLTLEAMGEDDIVTQVKVIKFYAELFLKAVALENEIPESKNMVSAYFARLGRGLKDIKSAATRFNVIVEQLQPDDPTRYLMKNPTKKLSDYAAGAVVNYSRGQRLSPTG